MIASETDLYACGYKVYIPLPSSKAGNKSKPRALTSVKEFVQKPSKQVSPLHTHVKELGKKLEFNDNVVTEVSPHLLSYSKSKGAANLLFKPDNLGLTKISKPRQTSIGRHDCRGEPKRHLPCHLVSSAGAFHSTSTRAHKALQEDTHSSHQPKAHAGRAGTYMTPPTLWEDKIPSGKTGNPSTLSIDQPSTWQKTSFVQNASNSDVISDDESDRLVSPPPRDYLSEYHDGARPVHQKVADKTKLVLDSGAKFNTVVQDLFPYTPSEWCGESDGVTSVKRVSHVRGYRKWVDFPQPTQTAEDLHWQCRNISASTKSEPSDHSLSLSLPSHPDFTNKEYFEIMQEWSSKWQIHVLPKDLADHDTILTDSRSLCDTTRMIAVASIALLAKHQALSRLQDSLSLKNSSHSRHKKESVDEEMVEALKARLEDTAEHVRVPSAITLYCINKQNDKAVDVLLSAVSGSSQVESWASVQCLSKVGVATLAVVEKLLACLHDQPQSTVRRASQLLAHLSSNSDLVHSLLSERLNSSGWLERLAACQILPKLHGGINKDVCHKLVYLAWNDWSPEVRAGASQALGMTGHGKMVHDEIGRRLTHESETVRLDALKKLQSLQLMTAQLLSPYLTCFTDAHTSIRIQAIKMAGALKLTHPRVQEALLSLLTHDLSWKVKVTTLQAIAECGQRDEALAKQLMWVVRFEKLGRVRTEGCRTIARLGLREKNVIKTLKDLLIVEEDPVIISEVTQTLEELGCGSEIEDDMLEQICSEVKRLGTQENITAEIVGSDRSSFTRRVIEGSNKPARSTRDIVNHYGGTRRSKSRASRLPTQQQMPNSSIPQEHSSSNKASIDSKASHSTLVESSTLEAHFNPSQHDFKTGTSAKKDSANAEIGTDSRSSKASGRGRREVWSPDKEGIDSHLNKIKQQLAEQPQVLV